MAQPRRLAVDGSRMREHFVDAAEQLLREVGGQGVSARTVAARAGQKTQLLYYYFRNMDDLLRGVVQRVNARRLARFEEALAAPDPLAALWQMTIDPANAVLATELSVMANRREAIRAEIVDSARHFRALQTEAVARLVAGRAEAGGASSAAGIVMIAAALSRTLVTEAALGFTDGHAEALRIVEDMIARLGTPAPAGG